LISLSLLVVYSIKNGFVSILRGNLYQLIFVVLISSFLIAFFSFHKIIAGVRYEISEERKKEKNVRDYYDYYQSYTPPDINN